MVSFLQHDKMWAPNALLISKPRRMQGLLTQS
jgi:hypothetical protein